VINADGILSWHEFLEAFGLDAGETKFEALAETAHQRKSSIPSPRTTFSGLPPAPVLPGPAGAGL